MTQRRFPPPWTAEETDACFIVKDGKLCVNSATTKSELDDQRGRPSRSRVTGLQNPGCIRHNQPGFFHFGRARAQRRRPGLIIPIRILSIAASHQGGDGPTTSRLSTRPGHQLPKSPAGSFFARLVHSNPVARF
jgi:hypothetical protein